MTENEVIQRLKNRLKTEEQRYGKEFVKEYFDDIDFAISAIKEIQQCREMDRKLREVYGDCEGLLEKAVFLLCDHEGVDVGNPIKARLLTDEDVDKWEAYKSIGTVEECREAVEKQNYMNKYPEEFVPIVEKWSKEHPVKTRQSEFLKMFPNAKMTELGSLKICPKDVDKDIKCVECGNCSICQKEYWLEEVE